MTDRRILLLTDPQISAAQRKRLVEGDFIRVGLVGCGGIVSIRLHPSLYGLPVRLAAICDTDERRLEEFGQAFGAEASYTNHLEMFAEAELDAVIVSVGPKGHPQIAIDAMEAGIPVLTEKPPALNSEATAKMVEVSRRTGVVCMTAFNKRFAPIYRTARNLVEEREFGTPSMLTMSWSSPPWYTEDPDDPITWFLLDFGIHAIDLARFLFGEVAEVYARKQENAAYAVTLAFDNGAVGNLSLAGNRSSRVVEYVDLTGDAGQTVTISDGQKLIQHRGEEIGEWQHNAFAVTDAMAETGYRGEIAAFLTAVEEGRAVDSTIGSAHETMRLYEAIQLSHKERRPVALEQSD